MPADSIFQNREKIMNVTVMGIFRTLGEENRLKLACILLECGELCVNDIVKKSKISQANASKHLKEMAATGVAIRRKDGLKVYYAPAPWLDELVTAAACYVKASRNHDAQQANGQPTVEAGRQGLQSNLGNVQQPG